jgi:hypothetical protein
VALVVTILVMVGVAIEAENVVRGHSPGAVSGRLVVGSTTPVEGTICLFPGSAWPPAKPDDSTPCEVQMGGTTLITQSDKNGSFYTEVSPGSYLIVADGPTSLTGGAACLAGPVKVASGKTVRLTIACP